MMTRPEPPLVPEPVVTPENQGFWDGGRVGELRLARCVTCGHCELQEQACVHCGADERVWVPALGTGVVKSFVVFYRGYHPYWETQVPYNVAVIRLAEGPELVTNVDGVPIEEIAVGMPVTIGFADRGGHPAPVARATG